MTATVQRIPLFDPAAKPASWNQRMAAGEFAVHYSSFPADEQGAPYCDVLPSLAEADAHARSAIAQRPDLRCRVYSAEGVVGAPLLEVAGTAYKGESNLSHFRRWVGGFCFVVGSILTTIDVVEDYRLMWPSTIGTRMLIPGAALLLTEGLVLLTARHNARNSAAA